MNLKKLRSSINAKRDKILVDLINKEGSLIETYMHDIETFITTLEWKFSYTEVATLHENDIAFNNITNKTFLKLYNKMLENSKEKRKKIKPNTYKLQELRNKLNEYWSESNKTTIVN